MCGLAGYISNEASVDPRLSIALPLLGVFMTDRGRQSWGWSNGSEIFKSLGELRTGFVGELLGHQQALLHTRHATFGAKTKENSHPFAIKGIIGAHNGIIYNHAEVAKKHDLTYEVDSEMIFHSIADGRDLSELQGYGAVTFWKDGVFHIGRFNNGDMALVNTSFGWAFASTDKALADALAMSGLESTVNYEVDLKQGVLYQLIGDKIVRSPIKLNLSTAAASKKTWQDYGDQDYGGMNWHNKSFTPGNWNAETKVWTPGSYAKADIPTITSGSPKNSLGLPTAETTTFTSYDDADYVDDQDERAAVSLERAMRSHQLAQEAQWAAYQAGEGECQWCSALVTDNGAFYDDQEICPDCYATISEADIAEDERRMLLEEGEDVEDEDDGRMYARDNDVPDNFVSMVVNFTNFGQKEVQCAECFDSIMDDYRAYIHQTLPDYQVCGVCYTRMFRSYTPPKIDLAPIAA